MNRHITPYGYRALAFGPEIVADLLSRLPEDVLTQPTGEDRFTPTEAIAHLADWEPIFQQRLSAGVNSDGAEIEVYDESVRAIEQGYANTELQESIAKFQEERAKTLEYVKSLTEEQLAHTISHPELGPITVAAYTWTMVGHDTYHIEQLVKVLPN